MRSLILDQSLAQASKFNTFAHTEIEHYWLLLTDKNLYPEQYSGDNHLMNYEHQASK